jgi:tryptophan synthase alpha chain
MDLSILTENKNLNKKSLVPYITAGMVENWSELVVAVEDGGADAVEIGLPFSDPMIDGPIIQRACKDALDRGSTTEQIFGEINFLQHKLSIPVVVMSYYNLIGVRGLTKVAAELKNIGVSGTIIPDLTIEELKPWADQSRANQLDNILLVAPSTPLERTKSIADLSSGFIYALGLMGITGIRDKLSVAAIKNVNKIKSVTDKPVLVGVGISTPEQAKEAVNVADGVVVGSAVVKLILDGQNTNSHSVNNLASEVSNLIRGFKSAIS